MNKKKVLFGIIIIILTIVISVSTSFAATTLFASSEVSYAPGTKEITSTNVQGAIDELATYANHYSGLDSRIDALETIFSNMGKGPIDTPAAVSVSNNTKTTVATITITNPGVYIVIGTARFNANATGTRRVFLNNSKETNLDSIDSSKATSGTYTSLATSRFYNVTSSTTFTLQAYQNSGGALTVNGRLVSIRLK